MFYIGSQNVVDVVNLLMAYRLGTRSYSLRRKLPHHGRYTETGTGGQSTTYTAQLTRGGVPVYVDNKCVCSSLA